MSRTDLIVAGAGLGGLSFLWHLLEAGIGDRRILVVDRTFDARGDRTWCFWGAEDAPFASMATTSWRHAELAFDSETLSREMRAHRYYCISSDTFRTAVLDRIRSCEGITLLEADVLDTGEDEEGAFVLTDQGRHDAEWVLQSIRFGRADASRAVRYPVRQHFGGLEIRTSSPVFDPDRFTMMDFRVEQQDGVSFVYILPFAPDRALVEHTVFSTTPLSPQTHYTLTDRYISERFGVDYVVERHEFGDLPMDDRAPDQQASTRVFNVGIVGGHIKPSTGYTFARVQRRTQVMAQTYAQTGRLKRVPSNPLRFAFYDRLLLRILHGRPDMGLTVFQTLFRRNDIDRVLRFLDERTRLREELSMFLKLPFWPFVSGLPAVSPRIITQWLTTIPHAGLILALTIIASWVSAMAVGLGGWNPGTGSLLYDGLWIALTTFLSTGVFITAHECMHGLVAPGSPRINRTIGRFATWTYAGLSYDTLNRAHHIHHAKPATEDDPDFHRGSPSLPRWYLDFMRQYSTWKQWAWMSALTVTFVVGLSLPIDRVVLFWALPLVASTLQLFVVGTWLPHRPGAYLGDGPLRARTLDLHPVLSLLACFHFGYHYEHHARPDLPWWRLWQVRGMGGEPQASPSSGRSAHLEHATIG